MVHEYQLLKTITNNNKYNNKNKKNINTLMVVVMMMMMMMMMMMIATYTQHTCTLYTQDTHKQANTHNERKQIYPQHIFTHMHIHKHTYIQHIYTQHKHNIHTKLTQHKHILILKYIRRNNTYVHTHTHTYANHINIHIYDIQTQTYMHKIIWPTGLIHVYIFPLIAIY